MIPSSCPLRLPFAFSDTNPAAPRLLGAGLVSPRPLVDTAARPLSPSDADAEVRRADAVPVDIPQAVREVRGAADAARRPDDVRLPAREDVLPRREVVAEDAVAPACVLLAARLLPVQEVRVVVPSRPAVLGVAAAAVLLAAAAHSPAAAWADSCCKNSYCSSFSVIPFVVVGLGAGVVAPCRVPVHAAVRDGAAVVAGTPTTLALSQEDDEVRGVAGVDTGDVVLATCPVVVPLVPQVRPAPVAAPAARRLLPVPPLGAVALEVAVIRLPLGAGLPMPFKLLRDSLAQRLHALSKHLAPEEL